MTGHEQDLQLTQEAAALYREIARDARRRGRDDTAELFTTYATAAEQRRLELEQQRATPEATA
jgi:hypothetical protein